MDWLARRDGIGWPCGTVRVVWLGWMDILTRLAKWDGWVAQITVNCNGITVRYTHDT